MAANTYVILAHPPSPLESLTPIYSGVRSIPMALAIACILPMIERYGLVVTNAIASLLALTGFL